jgi:hypothetical protein
VRLKFRSGDERAPAFFDPAQHALRKEVIDALALASQVGGGLRHAEVGRASAGVLLAFALKERDDPPGDPLHVVLGEPQPDAQLAVVGDLCVAAVYVFIPSPILGHAHGGAVQKVEL